MNTTPAPGANRAPHRLTLALLLAGSAIFLFGLGLFAQAGAQSRYWADDYCYSAWVQRFGLLPAAVDWYHTSGNRLTTLAAVAASELFGPGAIQLVTAAVLALWVAAVVFFLARLARRLGWAAPWPWLAWMALAVVFFSALLAPSRVQSLYWRMGTLHYTLPLPLLLLNLGLLAGALGQTGSKRAGRAALAVASALLAWFAAGLSETAAALQAALFALAILASLWLDRGARGRSAALLLAAPLAGTLLMMALMLSAPANQWRQAVMPPPENPLLVLPYALRYAADFVFYSLRGRSLPYLVYWVLVGVTALLVLPVAVHRRPLALLGGAALGLLVAYGLIAASFAPSAFAGLQYPAERAQMPAAFTLLAGLGGSAALSAGALRSWLATHPHPGWAPRVAAVLAAALLAALSLYPLRAMNIPRQDLSALTARAARWDARDAQIRAAVRAGESPARVRQTDVVAGLEDIGPDPDHWINVCAAMYYGAGAIIAEP